MYVDQIMTREVLQVAEDARVTQMAALMRDHHIRHLPVVRDGHLVGLVTSHDLERVSPSPITTLSVGEANYLLGKLTAAKVMRTKVITCVPDDTTRIAVHLPDTTGQLGRLLAAVNDAGGYIATVVSPLHPDQTGLRIAVVRYRADDPRALNQRLRELGYDLLTETFPEA
ncbi:MAG: domain signal transduction protein [Proteobacteria bacterium]|nr:domain signal transduction protein [Pseudomonadota bacterium]